MAQGPYVYGDLRQPSQLLVQAAETLDFARPAAVLLFGILASDVEGDALGETFSRLSEQKMAEPAALRAREEPGVAQLPQWHPEPDAPSPGPLPMWCGVARKAAGRF